MHYLTQDDPILIFGVGGFGRAVANACKAKGIPVKGFVQTRPMSDKAENLPVYSWSDLDTASRDLPLAVAIYNRDTPMNQLVCFAKEAGFSRIIMPWEIYAELGDELGWRYWPAAPSFLAQHSVDIERSMNRLADEKSRECLRRIVDFRSGTDLGYANYVHDDPQYFNKLTLPDDSKRSISYLDGGAYNGDSLLYLSKKQSINDCWLFEPDPSNYKELVQNIKKTDRHATCVPLALSDRYDMLTFSAELGEAGHLDPAATNMIASVSIDEFLGGRQKVDFIKLDVEGAEMSALNGAKETINEYRLTKALSCYQHPYDLWKLPDIISEPGLDYQPYMRQHAFNSFDVALYAFSNEIY